MSSAIERIENKIKLTITVDKDQFELGMKHSFDKNKSKINVEGFRKGKAPRKIIEMQYGKEVFYDDAINYCMPIAYEAAIEEHNLEVVGRPEIDITTLGTEEGLVFTATVFTKPEVTISDYKGITYVEADVVPTDEEIDKVINIDLEKNVRIISVEDENTPAKIGDSVVIDFEGFIDDVAFPGGKAEGYEIVLGSKTFIDTFEEQIAGHKINDYFDVNARFPEEYGQEHLAGKMSLFKVRLLEIKNREVPELNDDTVSEISEFDTLVEYKESVVKKLSQQKQQQRDSKKENDVMNKIIEKVTADIPEAMYEEKVDDMIKGFERQISGQGLSLEIYLQYMGQTMESLRQQYMLNAVPLVKGRLALESIMKQENITASDDELNEEYQKMADHYKIDLEKIKETMPVVEAERMRTEIAVAKTLTFVLDSAVKA